MSDLKFVDAHNLVAFLEKPTESEGFEEIVDFLNANPIKYALTINPTIYCHALNSSGILSKQKRLMGRDLQLEYANGVDCLSNAAIFEQLTLMRGKKKVFLEELPLYFKLCWFKLMKKLVKKLQKTCPTKENASLNKDTQEAGKEEGSQKLQGIKDYSKKVDLHKLFSHHEIKFGDQRRDASKQERKIADIDADAEVTLIDETQGRNDDNLMFDTCVLDEQDLKVEKRSKQQNANVRGVMIQEPSEFTTTPAASKPSQDKGKAKMIESKEPLKIKPKDQDKVETDYELAQRLQAEEQKELTIEEKSKLFQQLLKKRRKHFAAKRVEERRSKPPTKAQQRNMNTELVECSEIREEESSSKRAGDELEQETTKKQKVDDDKEIEDLQQCFELVTE
ncbi:hypothetical protein Tco_0568632 [Tanacetum coccineum]